MARPTDVAIDLETGGTRSNSAIISIGAASINRDTGELGPHYYTPIKLEDAVRHGRLYPDTMHWWRTDMAKINSIFMEPKGLLLYEALRGLNDFIRSMPAGTKVWGNGSHFDISILEHGYDAVRIEGFQELWKFWDVRDLRTAVDFARLDNRSLKSLLTFEGTAHHALYDAIHQAKIIAICWARATGKPIPIFKGGSPATAPAPVAPPADAGEDW